MNWLRDSTTVVSTLLGVNHWFESMSTHLSWWYFDIFKSQISFWDYNFGIDNQYERHLTRHGQACNTNYAFIMQMMESNNEIGHLDDQKNFPLVSLKWLYQKRVLFRGAQICSFAHWLDSTTPHSTMKLSQSSKAQWILF